MSAAPGWYQTALDGDNLRYWDGAAWTEHVHQTPRPQPQVSLQPVPVNQATAMPGWYTTPHDGWNLRYWDGDRWTPYLLKRGRDRTRQVVAKSQPQPAGLPALGIAIFAFALGFGLNVLIDYLLSRADYPGGSAVELLLGEIGLWIPLILAPIYVSRRRGTGSLAEDFGWRFSRSDWGIGAVGSFIGRGASVMVSLPLLAAFGHYLKNPQVGTPVDEITGWTYLVFALVACVGAPIIEELFFRGLIQTRMIGRYGVGRGIAISSVLFGAAHLIGWQGPGSLVAAASIAGGGVVLGYTKHRTGRLGASMVAHHFFNLFVVAIAGLSLLF